MANPAALAVIPARYASTRFPGKPLVDATGKPLIQHVVERVRGARRIGRVLVATDDSRIERAVQRFGGEVMMTSVDHPNGTARIAEVARRLGDSGPEVLVNVQGDEPEIDPTLIDRLVDGLLADAEAPMATLASPMEPTDDPADPNLVKLVVDRRGRAIYFSRAAIPFDRDRAGGAAPMLKHPGVYAYRRAFLPVYAALPPTPLEETEKLEQLRAIEHGYPIAVVLAEVRHQGIDTPEQYEAFVQRQLRVTS